MISLAVAIGLPLLAFAAYPLGRWRGRRMAAAVERRALFRELLDNAERERITRQVEAEAERLPC